MDKYKYLVERLRAVSVKNSASLNTRSVCREAADVVEALAAERDAAVADMKLSAEHDQCDVCKKGDDAYHCGECNFEWRGPQKEE